MLYRFEPGHRHQKHRIGFPGSVFLLSIIPNAESIRDFFVETRGISDYNIME